MKNLIDGWSETLRDGKFGDLKKKMRGKKGYVVGVGGEEGDMKGVGMIEELGWMFEFVGM